MIIGQLGNALADIYFMNLTSKGIYKITVPSGKVYVGMTTKSFAERWKKHKINLKGEQHHCSAL